MRNSRIFFLKYIICTFAGVFLFISCKLPEIPCSWSADPILIDGQRHEWSEIPYNYFEEENVVLALCNDSNNLYIMFSFNDPRWARVITAGGLTLWLDSTGKKNKDFGIRYYGGPPPDSLMGSGDRFMEMMLPEQINERRDRGKELTIIDKKENQEYSIIIDESSGPVIAFGKLNEIFTYEFAIPLAYENLNRIAIGAGPKEKIALGAEWGGIERQKMRDKPGAPPPEGIMGGIPGVGMRGRGGMAHGGMRALEKQEIWVTTILGDAGSR